MENGRKIALSTMPCTVEKSISRTSQKARQQRGRPMTISDDDRSRILAEIEKAPDCTVHDLHISLSLCLRERFVWPYEMQGNRNGRR